MREDPDLGVEMFQTRLLGRPVTVLRGPAAVRTFYDDRLFQRAGALPEPVVHTLFGAGAVHTLDGERHRARKAVLLQVARRDRVAWLCDDAHRAWHQARERWQRSARTVLFDDARRVLFTSACRFAGIPVNDREVPRLASWCTDLVDGFGSVGARNVRARVARQAMQRWAGMHIVRTRSRQHVHSDDLLHVISHATEPDGTLLPTRVAAVELINVVRPTVATAWYVSFAAVALHEHPQWRTLVQQPAMARAFAQEVRRFFPFAPFLGALARTQFRWRGQTVPAGRMVLLDVYGTLHSPAWFDEPRQFDPQRFAPGARPVDPLLTLIPQGGGHPGSGHRCPGEDVVLVHLSEAIDALARADVMLPAQDLGFSLRRMPTAPRSGVVLSPASHKEVAHVSAA